jgi:hypothetical protein
MLANHLNQEALNGNFAPSLPSSTTPAGKKKALVERANYTSSYFCSTTTG